MAANDNEGIRAYDEFFDALRAALKSADASQRARLKKALDARIGYFPIDHPILYRFFFSIGSACSYPLEMRRRLPCLSVFERPRSVAKETSGHGETAGTARRRQGSKSIVSLINVANGTQLMRQMTDPTTSRVRLRRGD
jgi:hypothetical protein